MRSKVWIIPSLLVLTPFSPVAAVTITWTGGAASNSWHTAGNWDLNRVPAAGDDVVIPDMTPNVNVTHTTGSTAINSLLSAEAFTLFGGTLTIDSASTLNGPFDLRGTLSGAGDVTVNVAMNWINNGNMTGSGKTIIAPSAILTVSDGFGKTLGRTLENHSANATWTATSVQFNNGTLRNESDGTLTFDLAGNVTISSAGGTNAVVNAGIMNKTGAGIMAIGSFGQSLAFNNSGTFNVDAGGLTINGGGANTGTIDADAGTTLTFGSSYTHDNASALLGQGTLTFNTVTTHNIACTLSTNRIINIGGVVNFNANYTIPGTVNLAATLGGSGDVTIAGSLNWINNGNMTGTGRTIIASSGSVTVSDGFQKTLGRTLENHSPNFNWTATSFQFNNGTLRNESDGTLTFNLAGVAISSAGGTNAVVNAGIMNKIGAGILAIGSFGQSLAFNNSGTFNLDAGGLTINGGGANTGTIDADAGTTLTFGSSYTHDNASALLGQGTLTFTTGTHNIACTLSTNRIFNIGGVVNFNANYSIPGTVNLTATLGGSGDVTVNGAMIWSLNGTMTGTGKTIIAASGSLTVSDSFQKTLSRTLENHSINATWTATSIQFNNGTLRNEPGGVLSFNLANDITISSAAGTNTIVNAGIMNKTGPGILVIGSFGQSLAFNNSGTFNLDVAGLTINGGGSNTGTIDADAGTTLALGSTITLDPASSLTGQGTLTFTNGANQAVACTLSTNRIINILGGIISFNAPYTMTGTVNLTGGTLSGSGDITIAGTMNWSGPQMTGTGRTIISPSGTLNMGPGTLFLSRVLENHSPNATWTPSNSSAINFTNGTLINAADGTFTANPTTNNTIHNFFSNGGTNAVINAGTFLKTGAGLLVFSTFSTPLPFTNTGTVRVSTQTLSLLTLTNFSGSTLTGGIYEVTSTLRFTGADIVTNAANIILDGPSSAIQTTGGANGLANFATNSANGTFQIKNGRTFARTGTFSNAGQLIIGPGDNTLSIDTVTNTGTLTKPDTGTGNVTSASSFTNNGTIDVPSGMLILNPLSNFSGGALTGGNYNVAGTLRFTNANISTNAASIVLDGVTSEIQDQAGINALGNLLSNAAGGSLQIKNGRNLALPGSFVNLGQMRIGPGASTLSDTGNYVQSAGATTLEGGTLDPTDLADINGGELKGNGVINGHVRNGGTCKPGLSAGLLTINGDYQQGISGALEVELGGTTAATNYDQLAISGTALLAGALRVLLINGFTPAVSDTFDILTAAVAEVKFQTIQLPVLPNLHGMQFADLPDGLRLGVIDCGPGDADGDGVGDACDTPPDLSWHTIDGGGGVSSGGIFKLSGTIGQPDACSPAAPMTGGIFTLVGGFWAGIETIEGPACSLPGDMNLDGLRNGKDIQTFAGCVIGGTSQGCDCADVNTSGAADAGDINPFVQLLINQ